MPVFRSFSSVDVWVLFSSSLKKGLGLRVSQDMQDGDPRAPWQRGPLPAENAAQWVYLCQAARREFGPSAPSPKL